MSSAKEALARAIAAERKQSELREQAEKGLALERRMREMASVTEKFTAAGRFMSQGLFDKAEEIMNGVPLIPQSSVIYNTLGEVYGRRRDWPASIRNFDRSVTADPTNHLAWHYLAPMLVEAGDLDGYQKYRERVLAQFAQTDDPTVAERMAKDCLILPPPAAELEKIARMADQAVTASSTNKAWPYYLFVKGLAEYRQGHFPQAVDWLHKVRIDDGLPARAGQTYAVLAMAEFKSGDTNHARNSLAEGIKIAEARLTRGERLEWTDELIAWFLLREAAELITGERVPDPYRQ